MTHHGGDSHSCANIVLRLVGADEYKSEENPKNPCEPDVSSIRRSSEAETLEIANHLGCQSHSTATSNMPVWPKYKIFHGMELNVVLPMK